MLKVKKKLLPCKNESKLIYLLQKHSLKQSIISFYFDKNFVKVKNSNKGKSISLLKNLKTSLELA